MPSTRSPDDAEVRIVRVDGDPAVIGMGAGRVVAALSFAVVDGIVIAVSAV